MFAGKRPQNLGHGTGRLAPCKTSPNCVSSQADPSDKEHYIAPIAHKGKRRRRRHRRGEEGGRVDAADHRACGSSPATSTPSSAAS